MSQENSGTVQVPEMEPMRADRRAKKRSETGICLPAE